MIGNDLIFMHINRTGGTSITRCFRHYASHPRMLDTSKVGYHHWPHWNAREIKTLLGEEEYERRFRFTIVRNPWDRMLSQYVGLHMKVLKRTDKIDKDLFNKYLAMGFKDVSEWDDVLLGRLRHCTKRCEPSTHNRGIEPCATWFEDADMSYIGRFETLNESVKEAWSRFEAHYGSPITRQALTQVTNARPYKDPDYRSYYSEESMRLVRDGFAADIDRYGYTFK